MRLSRQLLLAGLGIVAAAATWRFEPLDNVMARGNATTWSSNLTGGMAGDCDNCDQRSLLGANGLNTSLSGPAQESFK